MNTLKWFKEDPRRVLASRVVLPKFYVGPANEMMLQMVRDCLGDAAAPDRQINVHIIDWSQGYDWPNGSVCPEYSRLDETLDTIGEAVGLTYDCWIQDGVFVFRLRPHMQVDGRILGPEGAPADVKAAILESRFVTVGGMGGSDDDVEVDIRS